MMHLEDLQHWQEGVMGEMDWLKEELAKEDITPENKAEYEDRMGQLSDELNGPTMQELHQAMKIVEDMMREEADAVEAEGRKMMMEARDEANRVMIHEWEMADGAAMAAEDKLAEHNANIQYEIDIIKELNLPEGEELEGRWAEISAMRDHRKEMRLDAADKRA